MQVVNPRSALLSNFEVLKLLRERETEQNVHTRAALVKKEGGEPDLRHESVTLADIVSQNTRTVQFEAIAHLSTTPSLTARQDDETIARLLNQLAPYSLTKLEKLQIVNLLPTSLVELYVIVEDLEDRFSEDEMRAIINIVAVLDPGYVLCSYQIVEDLEDRFNEDEMRAIINIVAGCMNTAISDPRLEASHHTDAAAHGVFEIANDDADWVEDGDADVELLDGARYGEFEDDLAEDAMDDD